MEALLLAQMPPRIPAAPLDGPRHVCARVLAPQGTQFTCFTGTQAHILTQRDGPFASSHRQSVPTQKDYADVC
jgi:hypothetical protein